MNMETRYELGKLNCFLWSDFFVAVVTIYIKPAVLTYVVGGAILLAAIPFLLAIAVGMVAWYGAVALLILLFVFVAS
ncbi:hypothetical protein A1QO_11420 [Vibrio genomosp. F10 str. ZF-129]|uniref:Uncharacterized protein n=1 Tax=Vibrio genomosp. F10 str. ZF-129 TaxID=1187848 RepID=A0A1E5BCK0_9VIBR|nr:hypothetical protein A1QO_11420 [Vibrio genomosp. F10 str. ZF-129]OEE98138.1 hypothetical protein A1QM_12990 [Vibrio genomosp. F10 str. 9ZC157]